MKTQELFRAVEAQIAKLERDGHQQAAGALKDGYRCLNGLTDGWALFLESVEQTLADESLDLSREDRQALEAIRAAAHRAVYRR